jgi:hypothetical protein
MPTSQFERLMLRTSSPAALWSAVLLSELSARGPVSVAVTGVRGDGALFRVSAGVAQLVERQFSKLNVASSNLVSRSLLISRFISRGRPNPRGFSVPRVEGRSGRMDSPALHSGRPDPRGSFVSRGRPNPRGLSVSLAGFPSLQLDSPASLRGLASPRKFRTGGRSARRVVAVCGPAGSRAKDFVSRGDPNPRGCLISRGLPCSRVPPAHLAQLVEHVLGKDEVISSILMVGSQSGCGVSPPKLRTSCAGGVLAKRRGLVS